MRIKEVSYRRNVNLGNYETEHVEMTADVMEGDDPQDVKDDLKYEVNKALGLRGVDDDEE